MKSQLGAAIVVSFWFCINPLVEGEDGTLPLPYASAESSETNAVNLLDSYWDLLCR